MVQPWLAPASHSNSTHSSTAGSPWQAVGYNDYRLTAAPGGYVCDTSYGELSDDELDARIADGFGHELPVPFYQHPRGRFVRELL